MCAAILQLGTTLRAYRFYLFVSVDDRGVHGA